MHITPTLLFWFLVSNYRLKISSIILIQMFTIVTCKYLPYFSTSVFAKKFQLLIIPVTFIVLQTITIILKIYIRIIHHMNATKLYLHFKQNWVFNWVVKYTSKQAMQGLVQVYSQSSSIRNLKVHFVIHRLSLTSIFSK